MICSGCGKDLELGQFRKGKKRCRSCRAEYHKEWHHKTKDARSLMIRKWQKKSKVSKTKLLIEYLKEHSCLDCGEDDPVVLQFDHVKGKKIEAVSVLVSQCRPWSIILEEIEKCEVVCANCHLKRTSKRGGWTKTVLRD